MPAGPWTSAPSLAGNEGLPCSGRDTLSNTHEGSSCNDSPPDLLHSDPSPLQMTTLSPQAHRPWQLSMGKASTFTRSRHKVLADTAFASITLGCGRQQEQSVSVAKARLQKLLWVSNSGNFGIQIFLFRNGMLKASWKFMLEVILILILGMCSCVLDWNKGMIIHPSKDYRGQQPFCFL